jgi:hypothetical protein
VCQTASSGCLSIVIIILMHKRAYLAPPSIDDRVCCSSYAMVAHQEGQYQWYLVKDEESDIDMDQRANLTGIRYATCPTNERAFAVHYRLRHIDLNPFRHLSLTRQPCRTPNLRRTLGRFVVTPLFFSYCLSCCSLTQLLFVPLLASIQGALHAIEDTDDVRGELHSSVHMRNVGA